MGVIQGSLYQMLGSVAGAAIGIKHIKNQEVANSEKATEDVIAAESDISDLNKEAKAIMEENPVLGTPGEAEALALEEAEGGEDLAMAKKALETLSTKIEARKAMVERSNKIINKPPTIQTNFLLEL